MLLHEVTTDALQRLDDELAEVWSRSEVDIYGRDGYDLFARQTKCIWDIVVIPNLPPTGGYGSDLQRHVALQKPGSVVHDRRILFTQPGERDRLTEPVAPLDAIPIDATNTSLATGSVAVARLPDGVVGVFRVTWDRKTLVHDTPQNLRRLDPMFESREGDPQKWLWTGDGLLAIRIWPAAGGDASYNDLNGTRGFIRATDDATRTLNTDKTGGRRYGFIRVRTDGFPACSPRAGFGRRRHPDAKNIRVEVARLGRNPATFSLEIPRIFQKYIVFYVMHRALKRKSPGQDLKLSQHFLDRFELGAVRMKARVERVLEERRGQIGGGAPVSGQMGFSLPAYWGRVEPFRG